MDILKVLKQPFPYNPGIKRKIIAAILFALFVFIFLIIFEPFGLDVIGSKALVLISFKYAVVTFFGVLFGTLIFIISPSTFTEASWTTGKQIMFTAAIIIFVGVLNYLVSPLIVNKTLNLSDALWFQGITLAISIIPVSIFFLIKQNQLLKKFSAQAELIEKQLIKNQNEQNKQEDIADDKKVENQVGNNVYGVSDLNTANRIVFLGDYQNDKIELDVDELYFISSASNYIKIYHLENDKLVYSIIRLTLKKAEEILKEYPIFLKCHRAFVINIDKVVHVEGTAQGFRIKIRDHDELIPISRSINKEFSDRLLAYRKKTSVDK